MSKKVDIIIDFHTKLIFILENERTPSFYPWNPCLPEARLPVGPHAKGAHSERGVRVQKFFAHTKYQRAKNVSKLDKIAKKSTTILKNLW